MNININLGGPNYGGGGFGGAGFPALTGLGSPNGLGTPNTAMDPMMGMMMSMMSLAMMALVAKTMGQVAMPGMGAFGGTQAGGFQGGSPLGSFLGSGSSGGMMGSPGGASLGGGGNGLTNGFPGAGSMAETGSSTPSGPAGNVGSINVEKLVNAVPAEYRDNARKHWPAIVAEAQKQGVTNKAQLAYILATTVHESAAGKYMEEIASGSAYEGRSDLGNSQSGDGVRYKGRGYVQITGRNNYTNWSKKLGVDLVGNPELAERPEIAAKILVGGMKEGSFTGKGLNDYINDSKTDFVGARRIVNGTDKANTFAATAQAILGAMD